MNIKATINPQQRVFSVTRNLLGWKPRIPRLANLLAARHISYLCHDQNLTLSVNNQGLWDTNERPVMDSAVYGPRLSFAGVTKIFIPQGTSSKAIRFALNRIDTRRTDDKYIARIEEGEALPTLEYPSHIMPLTWKNLYAEIVMRDWNEFGLNLPPQTLTKLEHLFMLATGLVGFLTISFLTLPIGEKVSFTDQPFIKLMVGAAAGILSTLPGYLLFNIPYHLIRIISKVPYLTQRYARVVADYLYLTSNCLSAKSLHFGIPKLAIERIIEDIRDPDLRNQIAWYIRDFCDHLARNPKSNPQTIANIIACLPKELRNPDYIDGIIGNHDKDKGQKVKELLDALPGIALG